MSNEPNNPAPLTIEQLRAKMATMEKTLSVVMEQRDVNARAYMDVSANFQVLQREFVQQRDELATARTWLVHKEIAPRIATLIAAIEKTASKGDRRPN